MARKNVTSTPASATPKQPAAVDLVAGVALARQLISLAAEQTRQANVNLDLAKVGLAELEIELARAAGGAS